MEGKHLLSTQLLGNQIWKTADRVDHSLLDINRVTGYLTQAFLDFFLVEIGQVRLNWVGTVGWVIFLTTTW